MNDIITLTVDRRLLAHPRALHLRRMRLTLWLYLALLAHAPAGAESFDVDPVAIGVEMGLTEGTVRSWLGHLRKGGYVEAERLNGVVRVRLKRVATPAPATVTSPEPARFFTVPKLEAALGERGDPEALEDALSLYGDEAIKGALARTLAVRPEQIRRSRTALFLYLLKHHAHAS